MSENTPDRFTAGERLLPPEPTEPGSAPPRRGPAKPPRPRRRFGFGAISLFTDIVSLIAALVMLGVVVGGLAGYSAYQRFSADLPDVSVLQAYQPRVMSRIYAADGSLLAELATERRIFVPVGDIPDMVKQAFISAEDQNFYTHHGVDPVAILRAAVTDVFLVSQGRRPIGASTITQQVAKNMLLSSETTISRKAREALLAVRIEQSMNKEHILELYLNEIYLGLQAYGVAAAAQAYFNKSLDELTLPEAAFLAALPKAPNNYNPFKHPDAARARRDFVIDRMRDDGAITQAQADAAKADPVKPAAFRRPEVMTGGEYFTEEVRRWLVETYGADRTTQGGLVVRTTLDPLLQRTADKAVRNGLLAYDRRRGGWRGPVKHLNAAPGSGFRTQWATELALQPHPPGMPQEWQMGVVIETTDSEATIGILNHVAGMNASVPRALKLPLSDLGWARPAKAGQLGPNPRKITDVVSAGDVVMVEVLPATAAHGKIAAKAEKLALRQIPVVESALVSLEPATGRVLALTGGWSFEQSQFDRATQAERQPGSSFKPFVYLTALEAGISPSQKFLDAPFVVDQGALGKWRPGNFEGDFNGPVPLRVALEQSMNLVTVRVADHIGMEAVAKNAIAFHMVDTMPRVLSAALGAIDTTVMREAGAYASLATGGREVTPTFIDTVQDRDGKVIWRADARSCPTCADPTQPPHLDDARPQLADPQSVYQLTLMMEGVVTRGTGVAAGEGLGHEIAGKTGTAQDFQDAWFSGFTPDLATSVWTGYDTPTTLGNNETGAAASAPTWHEFMAVALKNRPKLTFPIPDGLTLASWDAGNGTVTDAFKPGQVPGGSESVAALPTGATPLPNAAPGTLGAPASPPTAPTPPAPAASAVDTGLGGLY
ncbi:MAG: PBP1A family penicillin-binding protein [Acetobacteraceae bacterium]|nr:PBP1A family penicillin-binding protein [Acetobacteraceae bacterium]